METNNCPFKVDLLKNTDKILQNSKQTDYTELPNQNLRSIGPEVPELSSDTHTNTKTDKQRLLLYVYIDTTNFIPINIPTSYNQ